MRYLYALLFLSSVFAKNLDPVIKFSESTHPNYHGVDEPVQQDSLFTRVKRSIFAAAGIGNMCEIGWSGQFCEHPVCPRSEEPSYSNGVQKDIDHLFLPSGCTGKYYVPYDIGYGLFIVVSSSAGVPYINLTDSYGNVMQGQGTAQPTASHSSYNSLSPGAYQLTIDNGGVPTTFCNVEISMLSPKGLAMGFISSPQTDYMPDGTAATEGIASYAAIHISNTTLPAQPRTLTIREMRTMLPVYRTTLTTRYGCGYEFYAGTFSCKVATQYVAVVDGIDEMGNAFRRSKNIQCMQQIVTPAPTEAPLARCYNGGSLLYPGTTNATCFCPELFTDKDCSKPNCMNGGFLDPAGVACICDAEIGFSGANCEHMTCGENLSPYITDKKTLILVIRNTVSMNQYIPTISNTIQRLSLSPDQFPYSNYLLVRFANGVVIPRYHNADFNSFMADLNSTTQSAIVGGCNDTTFDALFTTFTQNYIYSKSPVLLFTDAYASDVDNWRSVAESNTGAHQPIYSFFMQQPVCNFDPLNPGYRVIQRATQLTGGLAYLPQTDHNLGLILEFVMRATAPMTDVVVANDLVKCNPKGDNSFMIDSSASSIIIMATGNNLNFFATDPDGDSSNFLPVVSVSGAYFWDASTVKTGEYIYNIASDYIEQPCSWRVITQSQYNLWVGSTLFEAQDAFYSEPIVGTPLSMVAQVNGLLNNVADPYRLFAEMTIFTNENNANQVGKPMYFSSGTYRDGCGFHLYFGVQNFCEFDNQQYYATVYVDDNNGFTIQRTQIGFCTAVPTTPNNSSACQHGGAVDPNNNQTCLCPPQYYGDHCEKILCQNGGTPQGSICQCAPGLTGTYCEIYTCPAVNPQLPNNFNDQSMVFVVSVRSTMQNALNQLADGIQDFVREVQTEKATWITNWAIVYVNEDFADLAIKTTSGLEFANAMISIAQNTSTYQAANPTNCSIQLQEGILQGIYLSNPRSSVYIFADSDGPDTHFGDIYYRAMDNQITLNLIGASDTICGLPGSNSSTYFNDDLQALIYDTSGYVYITPQVKMMLPFIVSSYQSGMIAQGGSDDCSQGLQIDIPVDSFTQSFTIAVTGSLANSTITVALPIGREEESLPLPFYEDPLVDSTYLKLNQYITACPNAWNFQFQQCYRFTHEPQSWTTAAQICHSQQAALVDVFNQQKQDWLLSQTGSFDSWIGLVRHKEGFVWDVPSGNNFHTLDPSFAPWCGPAQGGVQYPVNDNNTDCVKMDGANKCWKNIACSTSLVYGCQLARYGQGLYPLADQSVPPGRWRLNMQMQGGCYAQVRAQSDIQVIFGFTNDPHSDFPNLMANAGSKNNYLVANPVGLIPFEDDRFSTMEGMLNYALIGYNNSLTNALPLSIRAYCAYPVVSQAFTCNAGETGFYIKFSGIDQFGFAFDRYADSICMQMRTNCGKNGIVVDGSCQCLPGWSGSICTEPICQNGGAVVNGACKCPVMYEGTFCEQPICEPPYPATFGDGGKTLAILVEHSFNMKATIFQLKRNILNAINGYNSDPTTPGWFANYIVYPFDLGSNKAQWFPPTITTNPEEVATAIANLTTVSCPGPQPCSTYCPRPIFSVLNETLQMPQLAQPNSVILVITRSSPEDTGLSKQVAKSLQASRVQLNYVYPSIDSPCSEGWNTPAAGALFRTVSYSDGNVFTMSSVDLATNFLTQYIPTLYRSAGLASGAGNCTYQETLFQVEHEMYEFTIDYAIPVTDPPMQITLRDPDGEFLTLPPNMIASDSNYIGVLKMNESGPVRAGTYSLTISGGGGNNCYLNVRGRSGIELFPAYVVANDGFNGATNDKAYTYPTALQNNTIVVHADGLGKGSLSYAEIVIPGFGLYHTTTLKRRDSGCSYEWYGTVPFSAIDDQILTIVYGTDERGANFHRNYYSTPVSTNADTRPPPTWCDVSTVIQDTVFLIDSSVQIDASGKSTKINFQTFQSFASTVMLPYTLSANNTQVAAVMVADKGYFGFDFLKAVDQQSLMNSFDNLQYVNVTGQDSNGGFQTILDTLTSASSGYRDKNSNGLVNNRHNIVYITSTNPTDADPRQLPATIKRGGQYGIQIIAYDMVADNNLKSMVSPDCYYYATDFNDLFNNGLNFVRSFSCYRNPRCGM